MNWAEILIKNKEGVVVINRIHSDRYVPTKGNNTQSNQGKLLLFEEIFLSSTELGKKIEEKRNGRS